MGDVLRLISVVLDIMTFAIFARSILTWFPQSRNNPVAQALFQITEPIIAPFRRIIPRFGMMDLSPLVALIVLQLVSRILSDGIRG